MPSVTIRDLLENVLEALRGRARRDHRSPNGERLSLLETHAFAPATEPRRLIDELREIHERYDIPDVDHTEIDRLKRRGRDR